MWLVQTLFKGVMTYPAFQAIPYASGVKKKKVKLFLYQAVDAHRVVRRQGSHIFYTISS
jgi:hypothetical protein